MFYTKFVSASKSHIVWIQSKIKESLNINGAIGKAKSVYQLSYAKKESKILAPKIYYDKEIPYLKRKHDKLQKFLIIDKRKSSQGRVMESADIYV